MIDITVILPSRGRVDTLELAVASLLAKEDPGVEIIVGLDDDDPTRFEASDRLSKYSGARVLVNPFPRSVGDLFNVLYKEARGDWFIPFPNDYTVATIDWAERLRHAVSMLPRGLGVAYLRDRLYPGFSTFPVVSRKTIELNGFFMPDFFPFLFGDTWWNEIGNLSGCKQPIDADVVVNPREGNEHRLRDMALWASVFETTRAMRSDTAIKILQTIYEGYEDEAAFLISTMPSREELCKSRQAHMFGAEFLSKWDNTDERPASARYLAIKARAEALLKQFPINREEEIQSA